MNLDEINLRLNTTEKIINDKTVYRYLDENLSSIKDIQRLTSKIALLKANARDLKALSQSLTNALSVINFIAEKNILTEEKKLKSDSIQNINEFNSIIKNSILDDPPVILREGKIINPEYNQELKSMLDSIKETKEWIANLEHEEKKRTGISNLKVGFNSVFGYYIEITRSNIGQAPDNYIRKQTLVNAERYITEELKAKESIVLSAEEKIAELEFEIFNKILADCQKYVSDFQIVSDVVGFIDCVFCFAKNATTKNYTKPLITPFQTYNTIIKESRHPVVETFINQSDFVPNDIELTQNSSIHLITGPNMAGKSTYIRQTALIQIMAQIGSYVPAYSAQISIVDAIYTRIGAGDALIQGLSTFMVEMIETAKILHNATSKSLVILDEVGRGTSTLDGLSIARAVLEYIHEHIKCKTLFATHFHELAHLAQRLKSIENYRIKVGEVNNQIKFLHKVEKGFTDKSYGIEVAKIAGLPEDVIVLAKKYLNYENKLQLPLGF
ncbi:MAG: DNA mismatch repair protein MutS [Niabella sp.]|nr:MAG: DNA mismatch repair protein MutS [Niabella sp.]